MAIAIRAIEICSPVDKSMSISRAGGCSLISLLLGADGAPCCSHDPLSIRYTGAAEFLHDQTHFCYLLSAINHMFFFPRSLVPQNSVWGTPETKEHFLCS